MQQVLGNVHFSPLLDACLDQTMVGDEWSHTDQLLATGQRKSRDTVEGP